MWIYIHLEIFKYLTTVYFFFFHYQAVGTLQQQSVQPAAPPVTLDTHPMNLVSPVPPTDPLVRKQVVQDLMAQMQGTYNFMQVWLE